MDIVKIVGIGIISAIMALLIREQRASLGVIIGFGCGCVILLLLIDQLGALIEAFSQIAQQAQIESSLVTGIIKIIGVAYIAEFGISLIRDAGETSLAAKVEMAARLIIVMMAMPAIGSIMTMITSLLQNG